METRAALHVVVKADTLGKGKEEREAAVHELEDASDHILMSAKVASAEVLLDAEIAQLNILEIEMMVSEAGAHEVEKVDIPETVRSGLAEVQDTQETEKEVMVEEAVKVDPATEKVEAEAAVQEVEKVDIPESGAEAQGAKEATLELVKVEVEVKVARRTLTEAKQAVKEVMELNVDGTAPSTGTAQRNTLLEIEMMTIQADRLNLERVLTGPNSSKKQRSRQLKFYEAGICIWLTSQIVSMRRSVLQTSLLSA